MGQGVSGHIWKPKAALPQIRSRDRLRELQDNMATCLSKCILNNEEARLAIIKTFHDSLLQAGGNVVLKGGAAAWLHAVLARAIYSPQAVCKLHVLGMYEVRDVDFEVSMLSDQKVIERACAANDIVNKQIYGVAQRLQTRCPRKWRLLSEAPQIAYFASQRWPLAAGSGRLAISYHGDTKGSGPPFRLVRCGFVAWHTVTSRLLPLPFLDICLPQGIDGGADSEVCSIMQIRLKSKAALVHDLLRMTFRETDFSPWLFGEKAFRRLRRLIGLAYICDDCQPIVLTVWRRMSAGLAAFDACERVASSCVADYVAKRAAALQKLQTIEQQAPAYSQTMLRTLRHSLSLAPRKFPAVGEQSDDEYDTYLRWLDDLVDLFLHLEAVDERAD